MLERAETELQGLVTSASSGTGTQGLEDRLRHLQHQYQTYLSEVRHMCQDVWAKFDLVSITLVMAFMLGLVLTVTLVVVLKRKFLELIKDTMWRDGVDDHHMNQSPG
nr:hypothetical protein BaRGS_006270 [Batillaria attramentaria]